MYGNFDAIKSRKKLRDSTTNSRKERVDNHKNSIFRTKYENVFPEISDEKVNLEIQNIKNKYSAEKQKGIIQNAIVFLLALAISLFIVIKYIYPFLF